MAGDRARDEVDQQDAVSAAPAVASGQFPNFWKSQFLTSRYCENL